MPFPEQIHLELLSEINERQIEGLQCYSYDPDSEPVRRLVGREAYPWGVLTGEVLYQWGDWPRDEVNRAVRGLLARGCIEEKLVTDVFSDTHGKLIPAKVFIITQGGLAVLDANAELHRKATGKKKSGGKGSSGTVGRKKDNELRIALQSIINAGDAGMKTGDAYEKWKPRYPRLKKMTKTAFAVAWRRHKQELAANKKKLNQFQFCSIILCASKPVRPH